MSFGGISVREYKEFLSKNKGRLSKFLKRSKHKRERQKTRQNIENQPQYKRFAGWFW